MICQFLECGKELTGYQTKYCSKSCANAKNPRRGPEGQCRTCEKPISSSANWCSLDCKPAPKGRDKKLASLAVIDWRKKVKLKLVEAFNDTCFDCGQSFPPFVYDFDHRDPSVKSFSLGGISVSFEKILEESKKCDMVCANCHRLRTHKQRCSDLTCLYCDSEGVWKTTNKNSSPQVHGTPRCYSELKCRCNLCKLAKKLYRDQKISYTDNVVQTRRIDMQQTGFSNPETVEVVTQPDGNKFYKVTVPDSADEHLYDVAEWDVTVTFVKKTSESPAGA